MLNTDDYYQCHWLDDNKHPWSRKTFREILDTIPDEMAANISKWVCAATSPRTASDQCAEWS